MPCLFHVFSAKELEKLNEQQLRMLDEAIIHEIHHSKTIRQHLRNKLTGKGEGNLYAQMTARRAKKRK